MSSCSGLVQIARPTAMALACFATGIACANSLQPALASENASMPSQGIVESVAAVAPLTLETAVGLALVKDLRYASALAAFRAAEEQIPQARAGFRPQISLNGTAGLSNGRPSSDTRTTETAENRTNNALTTDSNTLTRTRTQGQQDGLPGSNSDTRSTTSTATQSSLYEQTLENLETESLQTSSQRTNGWVANAELSMRWTIYRPGMERQLELSQIRVAQAEVQLQAARQDVVLRLTKAYFDLILSSEELRAIKSEKEAIEAQLKLAEQSFKEGETTIADVKEAEAKWDVVQAQEVAQRNNLQIRRTTLQALIGERATVVQSLRVDDLLRIPPALGGLDEWIARAEDQSHQVLFEKLGLAAADKEVARQSAAFKPSVDFIASLGAGRRLQRSQSEVTSSISEISQREEPSQSTVNSQTNTSSTRAGERVSGSTNVSSNSDIQSNVSESTQTNSSRPVSSSRSFSTQLDAYVGVRLNIPLYDGGFINSKVREALALQDQKALDLQRVKADASLAAETAFLEAQGFFAEASALKAAERSGEVALKSNEMGYQAGVRINSDILNAQQQLFNVRRDLIKTQVEALLATLRLRASAGSLNEGDVASLAQWLR